MRVGVLWYPRVQSPRDQWVVAFWSPMARAKYCPRRKGESISVFFVEFCCYSLIFLALENTAARFVVSSTPHSGSEVNILFITLFLFICLFVWSRAMCGQEKDSQFWSFLWNFVDFRCSREYCQAFCCVKYAGHWSKVKKKLVQKLKWFCA